MRLNSPLRQVTGTTWCLRSGNEALSPCFIRFTGLEVVRRPGLRNVLRALHGELAEAAVRLQVGPHLLEGVRGRKTRSATCVEPVDAPGEHIARRDEETVRASCFADVVITFTRKVRTTQSGGTFAPPKLTRTGYRTGVPGICLSDVDLGVPAT